MIFETIVSTLDKNKEINFAPFGIKKSKNTILIFTVCSIKNAK